MKVRAAPGKLLVSSGSFLITALLLAPIARADEPLVQTKGCTACHSVDQRVVGPAFHEVSQRYKNKPDAVTYLAGKMRSGGIGAWGQFPMPMQPGLSEDEARTLAAWILNQ